MIVAPRFLTDPAFKEEVLLDLQFGRTLREEGRPVVVAQLAGNRVDELMQVGKELMGFVDGLGLFPLHSLR